MKRVSEIEFFNHPIFGSQTINLSNKNGTPYNTIVIIGENGSGKTQLINYLYKILTNRSYVNVSGTTRESKVIIHVEKNEIIANPDAKGITPIIDEVIIEKYEDNNTQKVSFNSNGYVYNNVKQSDNTNSAHFFEAGGVISNVDINYTSITPVKSVTGKRLDIANSNNDKDIAAEIEQLIIDIYNQDNSMIAQFARQNPNASSVEILKSQLINRFTNAYKELFGSDLILDGVDNNINIIFKKGNSRINIHDLSSGEKQIVYRSVYLLRNIGILRGSPVFIDEPEISMHPRWERGIYSYYKKMFTPGGHQLSQIFYVTHSDYVIEEALNDQSALILLMRNGKATPIINKSFTLPTTTSAEIKYEIFDIENTDYHDQLYSYIKERLCKNGSIKAFDSILLSKGVTRKKSHYKSTIYRTLPTYIRNAIHHPESNNKFAKDELKQSIDDLILLSQSCFSNT